MQGFSKKSQEIIDYRVAHQHLPMETVAQKFGVKRQWVYILCKRAGVQSASELYVGMDCHLKGIPRELVESVKKKSHLEGMSMKLKTIQLWENYIKGLDKN
jgi:hypothetical protein